MNLRSLLVLSLAAACSDPLPLATPTPGTNPVVNPTDPTNPDPTNPDPTIPEPNFQLEAGWYEADVRVDVRVDNPITIGGIEWTINTTCDGFAVFEVDGERIQDGYWECLLPGSDLDNFNIGTAIGVATAWRGSLLRFLWGTYEGTQCTGELDEGKCSLKGTISGGFDQDTGDTTVVVSMKTSQQGDLHDLAASTGTQGIVNLINSFGVAPFTIDRSNTAAGNGDDRDVDFGYSDDTNTTDFEFDAEARWVGQTAPPYDFFQLTEDL